MAVTLWEKRKFLVSPDGYDKKYKEVGLYYSDEPNCIGLHWFVAGLENPCSRTWLNGEQTQEFIANAIIDEIIEEEIKH